MTYFEAVEYRGGSSISLGGGANPPEGTPTYNFSVKLDEIVVRRGGEVAGSTPIGSATGIH